MYKYIYIYTNIYIYIHIYIYTYVRIYYGKQYIDRFCVHVYTYAYDVEKSSPSGDVPKPSKAPDDIHHRNVLWPLALQFPWHGLCTQAKISYRTNLQSSRKGSLCAAFRATVCAHGLHSGIRVRSLVWRVRNMSFCDIAAELRPTATEMFYKFSGLPGSITEACAVST